MKLVLAALLAGLLVVPARAAEPKTVELTVNGHVALADLVRPGSSEADGVLLITHGTLAHKDMELVEALQGALAERGIATLAHTLTLGQDRREGLYDCAQPHNHAQEDALAEIGAWVKWLKDNGTTHVWLLGHSRGGDQTAWYAAEHPGAEKVVLMSPATGASAQEVARGYKNRFKADLAPLLEKAAAQVKEGKGDAMIDMPGFLSCPAGKASARSVVSYYGEEPKRATQTHIPKIEAPVLVIAGSKDTIVPDVPEKIAPFADGDKVRLETVEGAGHMFLEFYAEDAADLIAAFVKE